MASWLTESALTKGILDATKTKKKSAPKGLALARAIFLKVSLGGQGKHLESRQCDLR